MAPTGLAPRRAALRVLTFVTEERRLLSDLLPDALEALAPPDRARAQRLATETLRWIDRADRLIGPFLKSRTDPQVLNALRLAVVEMAVDGAAPHGVVNAAVSLTRENRDTARAAGLVNAVLRRVDIGGWDALAIPRLPKRLRAPLVKAYGKERVAAIEAAHVKGAPLDLTPRNGDAAGLAARVGGVALPTGSVRLEQAGQITTLPGFETGDWWVQDAAAALPAQILAAQPGESVLDLCAAPGGKTMQLAASGATVTALDVSKGRMARLDENLARTGLKAEKVIADALQWTPPALFDAVLLDAPCSATGTIRRHPDLPIAKRDGDFETLIALQRALFDRATTFLRPGGRLVYCTCSLLPSEGEDQVARFLASHPDIAQDRAAYDRPGIDPAWIGETGLRLDPSLWPDIGGLDGFFIAALIKRA